MERAGQEEKLKEKMEILKKTLSIDTIDEMNIFLEDMANNCKYISEKERHNILEEKIRKEQEAKEEEDKAMRRRRHHRQEDKKPEKVEVVPQQEEEPEKVDMDSDFKVDSVLVVDFLVHWMTNRDDRKKVLEKTTKKSLKQLSEREKKEHIAR